MLVFHSAFPESGLFMASKWGIGSIALIVLEFFQWSRYLYHAYMIHHHLLFYHYRQFNTISVLVYHRGQPIL